MRGTLSLKTLSKICLRAAIKLFNEGYTYRASALAFSTVLSLVPLLSVIMALLTVFPIFKTFSLTTEDYIVSNFVPASSDIIKTYLVDFTEHASQLPTLSILFLLFTAITLMITVEHTMSQIWETESIKKPFLERLIHWAILIFAPILVSLGVFLSSYLFSLAWLKPAYNFGLQMHVLNYLPMAINTLVFSVLYIVLSPVQIPWRHGFIGGFCAALLLECANRGFGFYIKQFPSYEIIYGAFATIPIFFIWIYIFWLIILYGALVTYVVD